MKKDDGSWLKREERALVTSSITVRGELLVVVRGELLVVVGEEEELGELVGGGEELKLFWICQPEKRVPS